MKRIYSGIDWFRHFRDGDRKAFEHLFKEYYPRILVYASRLLRQDAAANDIASRTFTLMWEKREGFESLEHLRSSLYVMTRNGCISHLRTLSPARKALRELNYLAEKMDEGPDLERSRAEICAVLRQRVADLPDDQRMILVLFYFRDLSISEIASELEISYEAVATRKCRAIAALRSLPGKSRTFTKKLSFFGNPGPDPA